MNLRPLLVLLSVLVLSPLTSWACCPVYVSGKPVVNADQTVIVIWDSAKKTQHFIRQASFKSEADDFGFLIPSPSKPELDESGNEAFSHLRRLTEPEVKKVRRSTGMGSAAVPTRQRARRTRRPPRTRTVPRRCAFSSRSSSPVFTPLCSKPTPPTS
jgi:hypothetical protein